MAMRSTIVSTAFLRPGILVCECYTLGRAYTVRSSAVRSPTTASYSAMCHRRASSSTPAVYIAVLYGCSYAWLAYAFAACSLPSNQSSQASYAFVPVLS